MNGQIVLDPLLPQPVLLALGVVAALMLGIALWRGLSGWWLRGLAVLVLMAGLANPSLQNEEREVLPDIVFMLTDESASNRLSDRGAQMAQAAQHIAARVEALGNTELRHIRLGDGAGNSGTRAMTALAEALAEEPRDRVAGAFIISDGQVHDMEAAPELPAPLHLLLTGRPDDWDRRLILRNAPAFAILGEPVMLTLRVEDQGAVPAAVAGQAELSLSLNGAPPQTLRVPTGEDLQLPVTLSRGGMNVLQAVVRSEAGELTDRNNAAVVQINGVRDRLSVLLVSGEPHAGQRTWRNLLKSDPSVDLVHFTILRPPDKQDGVPVGELSLIAFPTRELFVEKIDEFDLIIFDRYRRRGILPDSYFDNISRYVEEGGAVLVAAGPELASADSIWRSPLGRILPGSPTSRVIEEGFVPLVTALGARHPVTEGLEEHAPARSAEGPGWGRWFRQIELVPQAGQVVMEGLGARPLLMLDRAGEGRVALLASDHAWLWDRGFEGGGPQLELLRRLAHWMMGEPELEEEALTASAEGLNMTITRRSLEDRERLVQVVAPDGEVVTLALQETAPGQFTAEWQAPDIGLYRLQDDTLEAVVALGPPSPREFEETIATDALLAPLVAANRGGSLSIVQGLPELRHVTAGRAAAGRGWLGLTPRAAYVTVDMRVAPLLPAWGWLLLAAAFALAGWLREGRS